MGVYIRIPRKGRGHDDGYHVAAFYWPSMHDEPRSREVFWGDGIGENDLMDHVGISSSGEKEVNRIMEYLDERAEQPPVIILNAWNEWIEGSYLEPDMKWGYGYLEAVKQVMSGKYDKYR